MMYFSFYMHIVFSYSILHIVFRYRRCNAHLIILNVNLRAISDIIIIIIIIIIMFNTNTCRAK